MSTKIYNGYRLRAVSLRGLQDFTMRLRDTLRPIHDKLYYEMAARICCKALDELALESTEAFLKRFRGEIKHADVTSQYAWWVARDRMREREKQIKLTQRRDPEYDFDCEISVIPVPRMVLMLLYTEQEAYREAIESFPEITSFPYWNDTDQPEDISKARWDRRGQIWDKALGDDGVPELHGLKADLIDPNFWPEADGIIAHMPSLEQRVKAAANGVVTNRHMVEHYKEGDKPYDRAFEAIDFLQTEEGKAQVEVESERIKPFLKPAYNREDLFRKFVEIRPELASADLEVEK